MTTDDVVIARRSFSALGTTVTVATSDPDAIDRAEALLRVDLASIDDACSRFRPDSEISRVHRNDGATVQISRLLTEVVASALEVARATDGAVDPTVGASVIALGYDRDFSLVAASSDQPTAPTRPAPGWRCIELDEMKRLLRVPRGVVLDLGATAKAFAADRSAQRISAVTGTGVLVNLGGDVSVAGSAPPQGWAIGIALDCASPIEHADAVVAISSGAVASSGTSVRTWRRGGALLHHIVDPKTGESAASCWRLVSVAARSCVEANAASTAAVVWSAEAVARLFHARLPSRLVHNDGRVIRVCGWPEDSDARRAEQASE